ncbi:MAG: hypothetical protein GXY41_00950 [Phycisphaerae bacterium]|nr:hypothetical protein [Phycisphaerae bacterium]
MKRTAGLLIIALSLVLAAGCSKKEEPVQATPAPEQEARGMLDQVTQTVNQAAQTFAAKIDLDKTVAELKAEAEKMDVATLKEVAAKYKDAIMAKQDQFGDITEKLTAIPMAQRLGDEARQLTGEAQQITESLKALTDRLNVYVNAIKAKGGDVSGLTP